MSSISREQFSDEWDLRETIVTFNLKRVALR